MGSLTKRERKRCLPEVQVRTDGRHLGKKSVLLKGLMVSELVN